MSVASQSLMDNITYEDLYRRWEQGNWSAYDIDFSERPRGLGVAQRHPAALGDVDLLDVLLRRGPGRRHPRPLHHRRPDRGAVLLPRHPAGRRGPPLGLLPPLLQGGDRGRRRLDPVDPRLHPAPAQLGLPRHLRPPRRDGRGTAQGPLAAQVRAGDHALPPDRRGQPGPARPALHRGLLRHRRDDAGLQLRDGQRLPRRAAPHRLRRQGPLRTAGRGRARLRRRTGPRWSSCCAKSCPTAPPSSRRRTSTASTPSATASASRTSSPSASN